MFLGVGGRYQTTQVYVSGHATEKSGGADDTEVFSGMVGVDMDSFRMLLTTLLTGLSFFSDGVAGELADMAADLKSKAVPGVFGVLVADPKEAKAPEPRPKAVEPPVVGDASPPGVNGEMALKGFRPPCDESPPKRLVVGKVRCGGSDLSALCSECDIDRESLLVLGGCCQSRSETGGDEASILGTAGPEILPVIHWEQRVQLQEYAGLKITLCEAW